MKQIERILIATDFSECAEGAFDAGTRLARQLKATLILVHVVEPIDPTAGLIEVLPPGYLEQKLVEALDRIAAPVRTEGIPVEIYLLKGVPPDEIVKAARDFRSDLLVMGTHGRTGLTRLLMGSVTERVLRVSPIPLLAVRMQTAVEKKETGPQEEAKAA